ncbi:hypothetical protein WA026_019452 [Henosepilachna vigintioctopunctata]|uniref:Uncharacterized protein n=1 Tax=Henosepilachna vigintioctopunctata TaxID=420089 RepID=A0AAW1UC97_9CUCU
MPDQLEKEYFLDLPPNLNAKRLVLSLHMNNRTHWCLSIADIEKRIFHFSNPMGNSVKFHFHDLTRRQREELHGLKKHLLRARANSSKKSFIRGNKLFVGEEEYTLKECEKDIEDHQSNGAPLAHQPKGKKGQDDNDENFRRDNGTQYDVRKIHVHRTQTNQPLQQNLKILRRYMKLIWFQGWE